MSKVRLLTLICISLLLVNLFLALFLLSHKPNVEKSGPKKEIIKKLQFDELQTKEYEKLIVWHKDNIQKLQQKNLRFKKQLYLNLLVENPANSKDSLINEIGKIQIEIENVHYKHFQDIKKLCRPEQQNLFNEFCNDIEKLFAPPPPDKK